MDAPRYDTDAINRAVEKHWPKSPDGMAGDLYWYGDDPFMGPTWVLSGMTPVQAEYVVARLIKDHGHQESDFVAKA